MRDRSFIVLFEAGLLFSAVACDRTELLLDEVRSSHAIPPGQIEAEQTDASNDRNCEHGADASAERPSCGASPRGTELWRRTLGDDDVIATTSVAVSPAGDVFVASAALGLRKLDRDGTERWSRPFGSLVATDGNENVYVAGSTANGTAASPELCGSDDAGQSAAYVAVLHADGAVVRCTRVGGPEVEGVTGFAVDPGGASIVSGSGLGTMKLDARGDVLWKRDISGSVATDSRGDAFVTGALVGSMTFGTVVLESAGGEDVFVAKLDPLGNYVFARRFGDGGAHQIGEAVAVDATDDILVSGVVDGSVDFGGGPIDVPPGTCPEETFCDTAGFIVKLDPSGTHLWSRSRGPVRTLPAIAADSRGNVIVSGAYPGNVPPYRIPLLAGFDAEGNEVALPIHIGNNVTDGGAGHGVAVDSCDDVVWSFGAPEEPNATARSYLAKLAP